MKKKLASITVAILAFLVTFGGVAFAADAVTDQNSSIIDLLTPVYNAFKGGHGALAGALAVFAMLVLIKRYAPTGLSNWLKTDVGGSLMALGLSFSGTLAATLGGGGSLSLSMIWTAGGVAAVASGGYALIKKLLIVPIIEPLIPKMPAWMQPIAKLVVSFFDGNGEALIEAKKAGDAAVAANPAQGATTVVGPTTDVK